jgi:hypothetical protein
LPRFSNHNGLALDRVLGRRNDALSLATVRTVGLAEWEASARWITTPAAQPQELNRGSNAPDEPLDNYELFLVLGAIAEEVARHGAAVCTGIAADFAARMAHARRTLPRNQAAAAVTALEQARRAALQLARQMAQAELKARQDAARIQYRRPRRPLSRGSRAPSRSLPRR